MSLRCFTMLALCMRKRADLDLRHALIHPTSRPRSFAFHVVTHDPAHTLCVGGQLCGKRIGRVRPIPAGLRARKARQYGQLWHAGCESDASLSKYLQTDVSVERHLSRICPCLTRPLARCLSRAPSPHHAKIACRGPRFCGNCAALLRLPPQQVKRGPAGDPGIAPP